jgi:HEXXH motif-containing protein
LNTSPDTPGIEVMSVNLDLETIRTLLSPTGDTPLVNTLYKAQYQKTLLRLHRLHRKLSTESPGLVRRTRFSEAFEQLGNTTLSAQKAVLTYPSFGFWLDVACGNARERLDMSDSYAPMVLHLEDFGRFVLAAKAELGSGEFECTLRADPRGNIVLPGTATYLEGQEIRPSQIVKVVINCGAISGRIVKGHRETEVKLIRRTIPKTKFGAEFNPIDRDLRLPGRSTFTYEELPLLEFVKWISILNDAWEWVTDHEPLLAAEMPLILRAIVPVKSNAKNIHASGSFKEAPGLIALSWDSDQPILVDALVHEYHHQKLNALLNLDPLIVGPTFEPIYYSPWRSDARPLLGILHGVYTFQAVLQFWIKVLEAKSLGTYEPSIRERIFTLNSQIQTALNTLRDHAIWSTLGEAFFGAIVDMINKLTPSLPKVESMAQQRLERLQAEHKKQWDQKNTHLLFSLST